MYNSHGECLALLINISNAKGEVAKPLPVASYVYNFFIPLALQT